MVKVVCPAAIERVPESIERAVLCIGVRMQRGRVVQRRQLRERVTDRQEDVVDLRVLVCNACTCGEVRGLGVVTASWTTAWGQGRGWRETTY